MAFVWLATYFPQNRPIWALDTIAFPRNPDQVNIKWDKPNVNYETLADGTQMRVQAPQLIRGAELTMKWMDADRRLLTFIHQYLNPLWPQGNRHVLVPGNVLPAMAAYVFFDQPTRAMSKDVVTKNLGESRSRHDVTVVVKMDSYFRSLATVYTGQNPPQSYINNNFTGPSGVITAMGGPLQLSEDFIPVWQGNPWLQFLTNYVGWQKMYVENLGTAPWSPTIRIFGQLSTIRLWNTTDVDGAGQGTFWTWTGNPLNTNDYILFNTFQRRCYLYTALTQIMQEVYTFTITLPGSNNLPLAYWPPFLPGVSTIYISTSGVTPDVTFIDFGNNNQETFPYW